MGMDSADKLFLKLVKEVHSRGMKIIIDGVFNHMGLNSWAFNDVVKNQKNSKYKGWFAVTSWDDPAKGTKFDYEGWFGVRELPEFREDENGIVEGPKNIFLILQKDGWIRMVMVILQTALMAGDLMLLSV
jgi:cyclomaltodextrinase / maltogenic alpha-amylase / neopullulanase